MKNRIDQLIEEKTSAGEDFDFIILSKDSFRKFQQEMESSFVYTPATVPGASYRGFQIKILSSATGDFVDVASGYIG